MLKRIDTLRGHYIVCGIGRVGSNVAQELVATKRQFVVIDTNQAHIDAYRARPNEPMYLHGDAAEDLFTFLSPAFQVLYNHEPLTPAERAAFLDAYDDPQVLARLTALEPALTYRFGAYCAMRRLELEHSDPAGSARYARALALSIADLEAF